ncbi:AlkZ-related protein [Paenibacillus riograndensis]|nr:DDE transposase family protein [Paenibacillus riograndensis]
MSSMEEHGMVTTYEEMKEVIDQLGIVPLAALIPGHPSVNGLTKAENWHTDTELDPWAWRARFPGEGLAAYGKFIRRKAVLVAREWFPAYAAAAGSTQSLEERYDSGLCSREALTLLQIIRDNQGIETRELRKLADMKAKEKKTAFDNAVTELQGTLDIVISGVKERHNAEGEKNGWNSTSFETASHWMAENHIPEFKGTRDEAIVWLRNRMEGKWSPASVSWLGKVLSW